MQERFYVQDLSPGGVKVVSKAPGSLVEASPYLGLFPLGISIGAVGLDPTRPCGLRVLSPVRLPIPQRPRVIREYTSRVF